MQEVQTTIINIIRSFHGQPMSPEVLEKIKAKIEPTLVKYYNRGIIDFIPVIDINHREEIYELEKAISNLTHYIDFPAVNKQSVLNDINQLKQRKLYLERDLHENPEQLRVFLKDPNTYGPVIWTERGQYDH